MDVSVLRHGVTSGTAVYAWHLADALLRLRDELELTVFFGARRSPAADAALGRLADAGARVVTGPAPWRWSPDGGWWLPVRAPLATLLRDADVFHAGEFFFPAAPDCAVVATVHDLTTELFPHYHMRWNRWLHARRMRWIERRADRVITVSEHTRADLLRLTGIPAGRVDCVYEARGHAAGAGTGDAAAADGAVLRAARGVTARYVLAVGTLEPRKNYGALIEAFASLPAACDDVRLVIAGGRGWHTGPIDRALETSPARHRIDVLGVVTSAELNALYEGATVFAFPSLYEGFGLPLLEAMAAGTPVITANSSSLVEVSGDAALHVSPHSVAEIRDGLNTLLGDAELRALLVRRGRDRERQFTWDRTARQTADSYRRALEDRARRVGREAAHVA
jgi:glycosyltransferase involved in cell wall biosynthesis